MGFRDFKHCSSSSFFKVVREEEDLGEEVGEGREGEEGGWGGGSCAPRQSQHGWGTE